MCYSALLQLTDRAQNLKRGLPTLPDIPMLRGFSVLEGCSISESFPRRRRPGGPQRQAHQRGGHPGLQHLVVVAEKLAPPGRYDATTVVS